MSQTLIAGVVNPDGSVRQSGEEFSSQKLREGLYIVEFKTPLPESAVPAATIFGPEWMTFNMSIAILEMTPQYIICATSSPNRPQDCGFSFLVTY